MTVGDRIRAARKHKFTQAQLAEKIGVHEMTLRRWENGPRQPNAGDLQKIAAALGTTVAYLLSETDSNTPPREATVNMDEAIYPIEWANVPVYDIRTCAGDGTSHLFEEVEVLYEIPLPLIWIGAISPDKDKQPFLTKIDGDSMSEAGLHDGMLALINPAMEVYSGHAALVCYGEHRETAIKRVYYLPDGAIELRSATPGFPVLRFSKKQQECDDDQLTIIGRVMGAWTEPTRG